MAALITALDNHTPKQIGENGHVENGWSNNIREKLLQFSFQTTRTDEVGVKNIQKILKELLTSLKYENKFIPEERMAYLSMLYKMIGHTRDIIDGKGEYTLSYMMIYTWYDYYPELAMFALKCFVDLKKDHQYGSWKDIKYFCEYCKNNGASITHPFIQYHPLIQYSIQLINERLKLDDTNLNSNIADISLAAKWAPREKSTFGWLFEHLAADYFQEYMRTTYNDSSHDKAILKCKTEYRKLLSLLNRKIDTLQIKQCEQKWTTIDFETVTSISLSKQKKAFLNVNNKGGIRHPTNSDRIICAEKFKDHIQKAVRGEIEMKGKRVGMNDFTKQALHLLDEDNELSPQEKQPLIDLLNSQWRDNSTLTGSLENMLAMVDSSGSMEGDPIYAAFALGVRIAEKSKLGKRVLTFSSEPKWVNLDTCNDFVSQVDLLRSADAGQNTNFYAALDLILDAMIENNMAPEDVQDLILVILSDMQMDEADRSDKKTLYDTIRDKYAETGIRVHGKPYKPPHILFWNFRSTSGFPTVSNQQNTSMMSGFSPALLNSFCEQGIDAFQSCTPWSNLEKSLSNDRYKIMSDKLRHVLSV